MKEDIANGSLTFKFENSEDGLFFVTNHSMDDTSKIINSANIRGVIINLEFEKEVYIGGGFSRYYKIILPGGNLNYG